LRDTEENVPDGMLIDQCSTYILHSDGRLGKEDETKKDDCVIAAGGCIIIDETLPTPYEDMKARVAETGKDVSIEFKRKGWREQIGIETGGRNPGTETICFQNRVNVFSRSKELIMMKARFSWNEKSVSGATCSRRS